MPIRDGIIRPLSRNAQMEPLEPWYITGLFDGEGSFGIYVREAPYGTKLNISAALTLREDQAELIERMCLTIPGYVSRCSYDNRPGRSPLLRWEARNREQLRSIISHFDHYPLEGMKAAEYVMWRSPVYFYLSELGDRKKFMPRPPGMVEMFKAHEQHLKALKKFVPETA